MLKFIVLNGKNSCKIIINQKCNFRTSVRHKANISDLDQAYVPNRVENQPLDLDYFKPTTIDSKEKFSLILPPPNITGALHLGHALTGTIQDILVKWKQMQGIKTIWVPGLDHAGIATQVIVEKKLWKETGKTRHEIGREKFNDEVLKWKNEKTSQILNQLKRLGLSLNWDRKIFTMDLDQAQKVSQVFVELFEKNLIFRKDSLVNWSCFLQSAISDIEVEHVEIDGPTIMQLPGGKTVEMGKLYYFSYKICDSDDEIVVATTRPETLLGDVAVAVNPNDDRYSQFIGKKLLHPFRNDEIPIIADEFVDMAYGTGAVKITPAHNHTDFLIAKKHDLKILQVFNEKGYTKNYKSFENLDRFETRTRIIEQLNNLNLLKNVKAHKMSVPICGRSGDILEFFLKPQWYLKCSEMAEKAVADVRSGRLIIEPKNFENVWFEWLENIHDWCISRQLWWGHRIPVYNCIFNDEERWISALNEQEALRKASEYFGVPENSIGIKQDEDVLDTWFSSAVLPFTVFDWPKHTFDFQNYYPLSLMETGHDILFFWVARMAMLGNEITGKLPFDKILLHGIISDSQGRKMSKSLGNVILPESVIEGITLKDLNKKSQDSHAIGTLSLVELEKTLKEQKKMFPDGIPECGTDALRFTLVSHNVKNHFINFDVQECYVNKLFCNKIWQATKFTLLWYGKVVEIHGKSGINENSISTIDRWILSRHSYLIKTMNESLEKHDFHVATLAFKDFFYFEFCDIYLEAVKRGLYNSDCKHAAGHCWTLVTILESSLRALYPFMPFISVHLHKKIPLLSKQEMCYPKEFNWRDENLEKTLKDVMETVIGIRRLKKIFNINKKHNIKANLQVPKFYFEYKNLIQDLTGMSSIEFFENSPENMENFEIKDVLSNKVTIYLNLTEELRNKFRMDQEKLVKQKEKLTNELDKLNKMIGGTTYRIKATIEEQKVHEKKVAVLEEKISRIDFILSNVMK